MALGVGQFLTAVVMSVFFTGTTSPSTCTKLKEPKKRLLLNGSISGPLSIQQGRFLMIYNTCPFDSLCQLLATAYIDRSTYRAAVDASKNTFMEASRFLAVYGADRNTYTKRAEALTAVLKPQTSVPMSVPKTRTRLRTSALEYNCYGNVCQIANQLLPSEPSVVLVCCKKEMYPVLDLNAPCLLNKGPAAMQEAVEHFISELISENASCDDPSAELGPHLILDVAMLSSVNARHIKKKFHREVALHEFPVELSIKSSTFILAGAVGHTSLGRAVSHYIAYLLRSAGQWEVADDLTRDVRNIDNSHTVVPSLMVYVRM